MSPIIERKNPSGGTVYGIRWTDETGVDRKRFSRKWSKTQARAELAKVEQNLATGIATRVEMTVADLFRDWHAHHAMLHCTPAYQQDSHYQFRLRIEPLIGHRKIDAVNRRHVNEMIRQMKSVLGEKDPGNEFAGHATINKTLTVLKSMYTYAVSVELMARNPIHGIAELTEEPQRQVTAWPLEVVHQVALTARRLPDELPAFQRSQQAEWIGERNYALIMLAALTGLRQSEVLGLRWEQIDEGWIHVTHKLCRRSFTRRETKSKRGTRRVPLVGQAAEIVTAWRAIGAHDEIVFPNQTGDDHQRAEHFTNDAWTKARRATGIVRYKGVAHDTRKLTFHELRHTFVSTALAAGRDIWEVSHWAGDDPEVIKRVYGHYIPDSLGDTSRLDRAMSVKLSRAKYASRERPDSA